MEEREVNGEENFNECCIVKLRPKSLDKLLGRSLCADNYLLAERLRFAGLFLFSVVHRGEPRMLFENFDEVIIVFHADHGRDFG